jgi:predicted MFS family arabinose efflux permease
MNTELNIEMHSHAPKNIDRSSRISALLSLACAIHCALTPMLISVLPLLGLEFLASHMLEFVLLGFGLGFGAYSILKGYFSQHHELRPVWVFAIGAALIISGMFFVPEALEPWMVSIGALTVGLAQVLNVRTCKAAGHSH